MPHLKPNTTRAIAHKMDEVVGEYDNEIDGLDIPREAITKRPSFVFYIIG